MSIAAVKLDPETEKFCSVEATPVQLSKAFNVPLVIVMDCPKLLYERRKASIIMQDFKLVPRRVRNETDTLNLSVSTEFRLCNGVSKSHALAFCLIIDVRFRYRLYVQQYYTLCKSSVKNLKNTKKKNILNF